MFHVLVRRVACTFSCKLGSKQVLTSCYNGWKLAGLLVREVHQQNVNVCGHTVHAAFMPLLVANLAVDTVRGITLS